MKRVPWRAIINAALVPLILIVIVLVYRQTQKAKEGAATFQTESEIRLPATTAKNMARGAWGARQPAAWRARFEEAASAYDAADRDWWARYEAGSLEKKQRWGEDRLRRQKAAENEKDSVEEMKALERAVRSMLPDMR
jgi:hypothetical protein